MFWCTVQTQIRLLFRHLLFVNSYPEYWHIIWRKCLKFFNIYHTWDDYSFFVKLVNCHLYYSQKLACRILFIALLNLHNILKKMIIVMFVYTFDFIFSPCILRLSVSCTVKPVKNGHSKIDKTKILMTNGSLMKVERSILEYFWPVLSNNWSWKPTMLWRRGTCYLWLRFSIKKILLIEISELCKCCLIGWMLSFDTPA